MWFVVLKKKQHERRLKSVEQFDSTQCDHIGGEEFGDDYEDGAADDVNHPEAFAQSLAVGECRGWDLPGQSDEG